MRVERLFLAAEPEAMQSEAEHVTGAWGPPQPKDSEANGRAAQRALLRCLRGLNASFTTRAAGFFSLRPAPTLGGADARRGAFGSLRGGAAVRLVMHAGSVVTDIRCGGERAGAPGSGGADAAEQGFGRKNAARAPAEQGSDGVERRPGPERWFGGPEARPGAGWCAAKAGDWWRWRRWVGGASGLAKG